MSPHMSDFHAKQANWLQQALRQSGQQRLTVLPLCVYVNNHSRFVALLSGVVDAWTDSIEDDQQVCESICLCE